MKRMVQGPDSARLLVVLLTVFALVTCRIGVDDPLPQQPSIQEVSDAQPFLHSLSGQGSLYRGTSREALTAGSRLQDGDVVELSDGAVAQIQYEDAALARVEGPADFEIRLHARDGESVLTVMLGSGTTIVRRRPESTSHTVRIRTDAGIFEPESTSFRVTRSEESTSVQVASGRVRVLASRVDPDELRAVTDLEEILSVLDEISQTSVFVDADGMMLLRPQDVSTASDILEDMKAQLQQFGVASAPEESEIRTIQTVLRYAAERMAQASPATSSITVAERSEILDRSSTRLLPPVRDEGSEGQGGPARLTIETDPPEAEIFLDGVPIGNQIFSGLFERGETVTVEVRAQGYVGRDLEVDFTPDLDERLLVVLERRQPTIRRNELFEGVRRGNPDIVRQWVDEGGDPDVSGAEGNTALAVAFGAELTLQELLTSFQPSTEIVGVLLNAGADVDSRFEIEASIFTPLTAVVLSGLFRDDVDIELIELLLEAGASPDIVLETGEMRVTALTLPVIVGIERGDIDLSLIDLFLNAGADVHAAAFYEGRVLNPLAMALVLGAEFDYDPARVIERLIAAGARTNDRIRVQGTIWTPADFAEHSGLRDSARVLRDAQS